MTERFVVVPAAYVFLLREGGQGTEVLLQWRQNTGYMDQRWAAAAAGHVEQGETAFGAAQREATEELGITDIALEFVTSMQRTLGADPIDERIDFFFTAPFLPMAIGGRDDVELVVAFLLVGAAITELALWGRRQSAVALRRAAYLDDALSLSAARLEPTELRLQDRTACGEIARVLGADDATYEHGVPSPSRPTIGADGRIRKNTHVLRSLPTDEVTVIPVHWGDEVVGHVRVTAATRTISPDPEQAKVAVLLAEQIAPQAVRR